MSQSTNQRSNAELTNSLRANIEAAIAEATPATNGNGVNGHVESPKSRTQTWTAAAEDGTTLYVPAIDFTHSALQEEREQYDITVKLFYLPGAAVAVREAQTREALQLVLKELHMPSVDLLILSFSGIYFDEESEECPEKIKSRGPVEADPEPIDTQIQTWQIVERLHDEGLVRKLGLSEFGTERLQPFLERTRIRPAVDQINLRDCCSVPKALLALAKGNSIELLVHNDSTNVLPRGTVREMLGHGEKGAGVLAHDEHKAGEKRKEREHERSDDGLRGDVEPQWVIKYTAVVRNRGVVENKGYFAVADVKG